MESELKKKIEGYKKTENYRSTKEFISKIDKSGMTFEEIENKLSGIKIISERRKFLLKIFGDKLLCRAQGVFDKP